MKNPSGEQQKSIAVKVGKWLAILSFIFQLAEPFIVESHNLKVTSILTLVLMLTFGAFYLVSESRINK